MSNRLHSEAGDLRHFLLFFVCLQGAYHPKMCGFLSVWRFLGGCLPMGSAIFMMHGFLPSGPVPPFLCSYLVIYLL